LPAHHPLPQPAPERGEGDRDDGRHHDEHDRRLGNVSLGVGSMDLVRDQDRGPEDRAGDHPPPGSGSRSEMIEAGADGAEDAKDPEHQVDGLGDPEEVAGHCAVDGRDHDREQDLHRPRLLT
jgi:hypothetical protein